MEKTFSGQKTLNHRTARFIKHSVLIGAVILLAFRLIPVIVSILPQVTSRHYSAEHYRYLEDLFNRSQYRRMEDPVIIPDETVFSYAAGAYAKGTDPILVNSEHTPLGKYLIGLGIILFQNDSVMVYLFFIFSMVLVILLSRQVIADPVWSLVPAVLFFQESLFINQLKYTPLLDIFQLVFILLAVYAYLEEFKSRLYFPATAIAIGLVAASKTIVPALLFLLVIPFHLILTRRVHRIIYFLISLTLSVAVFLASYARTFMSGYTFTDFLGFQKWIFMYQGEKLIYPFMSWSLLFLNRWQTWWGDHAVVTVSDWQVTWPVVTVMTMVAGVVALKRFRTVSTDVLFLVIYAWGNLLYLSAGAVYPRFFLPFFPAAFILALWLILNPYAEKK